MKLHLKQEVGALYGLEPHTYRVFNKNHHKIVETVDVWFDESDGSQREHLPPVLDEASPDQLIKNMVASEIKPAEYAVEETYMPLAPEEYPNPEANAHEYDDDPDAPESPDAPETPDGPEAEANESEDSDADSPQDLRPRLPRVENEVQVDKILADVNVPGPLTRARANRIAKFCGTFLLYQIQSQQK